MDGSSHIAEIFGLAAISYFIVLNTIYLIFTGIAWRTVPRYLRTRFYSGADEAFASPFTPPISIILPAYNEELGIVESINSLLNLRYPHFDLIVVNDGSTDGTLSLIKETFDLVEVRKAIRESIPCQPVRASYVSRRHPKLWVIDKENGGKGDAQNCGINASSNSYYCAIDADSILEEEALLQVSEPILVDPGRVAAVGGIVRIANGCEIDHGRVVNVGLPKSRLATLQVVEYFRAFLVGRIGWSRLRALLIISGAFGLFRRADVERAGGYWTGTVGEDAELVIRLHRQLRDDGDDYRIEFVPDPVCWTEAPEDFKSLGSQRRRWQLGLAESLWRQRKLAGNPRYGPIGLLAVPYFILFELLGPLVELASYLMMPIAAILGLLSLEIFLTFFVVAILLGTLLSIAALTLEEFSFRRHPQSREVLRLIAYAVLENFFYRQLITIWRVGAFYDLLRGRQSWGVMRRKGMGSTT